MDFLELMLVFIKISIFARGAQMVRSDEALGSDDRLCHECFVIRMQKLAKGSWLSRVQRYTIVLI